MAKRVIKESIVVVRDGKRLKPQIGKAFDLTAEEIKDLERVRPQAIAKLNEVEEDPNSVDTSASGKGDGNGDVDTNDVDLSTMTKAQLVDVAKQMSLDVPAGASKADLIALIEAKGEEL